MIRVGLRGIKELEVQLQNAKSDSEYLEIFNRMHTLMVCVINDVTKEIGEREGEGHHSKVTEANLPEMPQRVNNS